MIRAIFLCLILLVITSGCQSGEDRKNVETAQKPQQGNDAIRDEFTSSFIDPDTKPQKGFYLFKSKTDSFTMNFPENATLNQVFYEIEGKNFENMLFGADDKDENTTFSMVLTYENQPVTAEIEANLSLISDSVNYSGEYLKEELTDKTIYYAEKTSKSKNGETTFYEIFGYAKSADSDQAVSFTNAVSCLKTEMTCKIDVTKEKMNTIDLMESIAFIN
ncbi:hypothetical protein [Metabacillus indicus]|uniref:hypothetical protein n=1 Tax=Metabacillus indicus TaxID=246786 RepID=UPI000493451F|nr:hypothetical protein [Metabacillus indicus]KEZ49283.1 hypothetical protein AZ46_0214585 [Metabacillus indicus LMG 22858]